MALKHILPKKTPVQDALATLADQLSTTTTNRRNYSRLLRVFTRNLVSLATRPKAEATDEFVSLQSYYNELAETQENLANAEFRVGEAIRDLLERFAALARATAEYTVEKEIHDAAANALIEALAEQTVASKQPNYEKTKPGLENKVEQAKRQKKASGVLLIEKVKQLILLRQKYSQFTLGKLQQSWGAYAQAKRELAERQRNASLAILDLLKEQPVEVQQAATEAATGGPGDAAPEVATE
jgi:hypothetical protein